MFAKFDPPHSKAHACVTGAEERAIATASASTAPRDFAAAAASATAGSRTELEFAGVRSSAFPCMFTTLTGY